MSHIFISYSRQDQAYVSRLVQALESHQLPVWIDDRIDYGTTWPRVIQDHLERCQVFIVVMSPRSEESHWVQCELSLALELKKPIFPLMLEGRRWLSVAAIQSVDVIGSILPPARFFDTLHLYCSSQTSNAESLFFQDISTNSILEGWASPTKLPKRLIASQAVYSLSNEDDLRSEKEVDYRKLENLLKEENWKEADRETNRRMLEVVGKIDGDEISQFEILNFSCEDLQLIDALWLKYSNGKWGFSIQKHIYTKCGAKLNGKYPGNIIWNDFCHRVGWRRDNTYVCYPNLIFDSHKSLAGELPAAVIILFSDWHGRFSSITERLASCAKSIKSSQL